jgi:hypothetical protein
MLGEKCGHKTSYRLHAMQANGIDDSLRFYAFTHTKYELFVVLITFLHVTLSTEDQDVGGRIILKWTLER